MEIKENLGNTNNLSNQYKQLDSDKNYNKEDDSIDKLYFYVELKSQNDTGLDTHVEMKGISFSGTIAKKTLIETLKNCFKRYFVKVLESKEKINKEDFIKMVNGEISPAKILNINEINVSLSLLKEHDTSNKREMKKPEHELYNYNSLIEKVANKQSDKEIEQQPEPEFPNILY